MSDPAAPALREALAEARVQIISMKAALSEPSVKFNRISDSALRKLDAALAARPADPVEPTDHLASEAVRHLCRRNRIGAEHWGSVQAIYDAGYLRGCAEMKEKLLATPAEPSVRAALEEDEVLAEPAAQRDTERLDWLE